MTNLNATVKTFCLRLLVVAAVALSLAFLFASVRFCWSESRDFPQYYAAARLYLSGQAASIYQPPVLSKIEHAAYRQMPPQTTLFCYPPFALPMLAWLGALPPALSMQLWTLLGISSLAAAVLIVARQYKLSNRSLALVTIAIALSGPFCESVIKGQPTSFMLLGIAMASWGLRKNNDLLAACGLCLLLPKPHILLPFAAFLLGNQRFRLLLALGALALALVILSLATATPDAYISYIALMRDISSNVATMHLQSCPTLRTQLMRLLPESSSAIGTVSTGIFLAVTASMVWIGQLCRHSACAVDVMLLLVLPLTAAFSIYFQSYDMLLVLPAVLVLLGTPIKKDAFRLGSGLSILAAPLLFAPWYSAIYHAQPLINVHFLVLLSFATICAMVARQLLRPDDAEPQAVAASTAPVS